MKRASRRLDWLAYGAERLGWPGLLGLALLLAALGLDRFQVLPMEDQAARLEARLASMASRPRGPAEMPAPADPIGNLALGADAPQAVARLFAAATHAGLRLEQGSYRPSGGGPRRYQIALPLNGEYPAIRAFLGEALERQPGLALDSLSLARENIASPALKARLGLTFYLREAP